MELLLVLAVLVAVAAMAWPAMVGPLETQRLRAGAEMVRVQWMRARVKAIETGRTYVFRFAPNGPSCVIEPWLTSDDYLESNDLIALSPQAAGGATPALVQTMTVQPTTTTATSSIEESELPENIVFGPFEVEADASQLSGATGGPMAPLTGPANAGLNQLSQPAGSLESTQDWASVYFYPDGTSTSARLMVLNSRGRLMVLSLRGLTGVVTVSDVKSQQEL
jgi:Tfp pilus assembly protein FimT